MSEVLVDLTRWSRLSKKFEDLGAPEWEQTRWTDFVRSYPEAWRQQVTQFLAQLGRQVRQENLARVFAPVLLPEAPTAPCPECGAFFHTAHRLSSHRWAAHRVRNSARLYASGPSCAACLKFFHTRPRLIHHLAYRSPHCLALLQDLWPPLDEEEAQRLDAQDARDARALKQAGHERDKGEPVHVSR